LDNTNTQSNLKKPEKTIKLIGVKTHGLKNINVELPHDKITVITGLSGSGKSSLAIDTLFAEGQRRYLESLSSYVRQFLNKFEKPEFERITGLRPAIAIEQKTQGYNPRSTVGTVTEIYDYLRILFARIGTPFSPYTNQELRAYSASEITDKIYEICSKIGAEKIVAENNSKIAEKNAKNSLKIESEKSNEIEILAPIAKNKKGTFRFEFVKLQKEGFATAIVDGQKIDLDFIPDLDKNHYHNIDVVVGSFDLGYCQRYEIETACSMAQKMGKGIIIVKFEGKNDNEKIEYFSANATCPISGFSLSEISPRLFSFNNPVGACKTCYGLGCIYLEDGFTFTCKTCSGTRLNPQALCVKIDGNHIANVCNMTLNESLTWIQNLHLSESGKIVAEPLVNEIRKRLGFLNDVGLSYLTLDRSAQTLSSGESQRIRLASQIGSELEGVLYILDEPSIGLHPKDNSKLIKTLEKLRDLGNTIAMVEHDEETMLKADYIIEMGPKAGVEGGEVVFAGFLSDLLKTNSLTAQYLKHERKIESPRKDINFETTEKLVIKNANLNNLKNLTVEIPLNCLVGICGVSGSGKSTLVMEQLTKAISENLEIQNQRHNWRFNSKIGTNIEKVEKQEIDSHSQAQTTKCYLEGKILPFEIINQSSIGLTPHSVPATYTGLMNYLRDWFAKLPESLARGYTNSRFSFNVDGGRCKLCNGKGVRNVEMHFLPDVQIQCEQCLGKRYNKETCEVLYNGMSIADVLELTISEAAKIFNFIPAMKYMLETLCEVHLGYVKLGQSTLTLSGGEAQRLKLARILGVRKQQQETLYILDEPTTGLHFDDINALLQVLRKLVAKGNSVIMIEHHTDLLKMTDWLIEIGPEGGKAGGQLIASGSWETLKNLKTPTGIFF